MQFNTFDDPRIADSFDLDVIVESDYEPPPKIAALMRQIDRSLCRKVRVVQLKSGDFFLRWQETHPEMLSVDEYLEQTQTDWRDPEKLAEYKQVEEVLPPKEFELPLPRQQAFALVAACYLPEEFAEEVDALAQS